MEDSDIDLDSVALQLKRARIAENIGLREMARRLDMPVNTYRHYEQPSLFKAPHLPMWLAQHMLLSVKGSPQFNETILRLSGMLDNAPGGTIGPEDPYYDQVFGDEVLSSIEKKRLADEGIPHFPPPDVLVPVHGVTASAGHGAVVVDEAVEYSLAFPPDYLRNITNSKPDKLAIISVKGESMEPTLLHDDVVLLDTSKTNLSYDGLFVLRFDDALHVKRVGRSAKEGHVTIISDNKTLYPPIEAAIDSISPIGKVLWYGRKV
ncbi:MAG: S24 family peptidase [Pseudomonadota bacterium]